MINYIFSTTFYRFLQVCQLYIILHCVDKVGNDMKITHVEIKKICVGCPYFLHLSNFNGTLFQFKILQPSGTFVAQHRRGIASLTPWSLIYRNIFNEIICIFFTWMLGGATWTDVVEYHFFSGLKEVVRMLCKLFFPSTRFMAIDISLWIQKV